MFSPITIALLILVLYLISSIKVLAEYERGVIFRLGRALPGAKGPGLILVFAPIDRLVRMSLRVETLDVPPQDVITRDNVTAKVNAVLFFRVLDPRKAVLEVANYLYATSQLAQTTLRSVLGEVELDDLLSEREKLNMRLQSVLDLDTDPWGIKVTKVEVKAVDLPDQMIRAIARQADGRSASRRGCPMPSPGLPKLEQPAGSKARRASSSSRCREGASSWVPGAATPAVASAGSRSVPGPGSRNPRPSRTRSRAPQRFRRC